MEAIKTAALILAIKASLVSGPGIEIRAERATFDARTGVFLFVAPTEESVAEILGKQPKEQQAPIIPAAEGLAETIVSLTMPAPDDGRTAYLEEVEPGLYRRKELADRSGYSITVRMAKTGEGLRADRGFPVELELAYQELTGGKFEESLGAYVSRPSVSRKELRTLVDLPVGQPVLVVWHPPVAKQFPKASSTDKTEARAAAGSGGEAPDIRGIIYKRLTTVADARDPGAVITIDADRVETGAPGHEWFAFGNVGFSSSFSLAHDFGRRLAVLLELRPADEREPDEAQTKATHGAPRAETGNINIAIRDAPAADVLKLISEASGVNVVVAEGVAKEVVTLDLSDVTADEVIRHICTSVGLDVTVDGNTYIIRKEVRLDESGDRQVTIVGAVDLPGAADIEANALVRALVLAARPTESADLSRVLLVRPPDTVRVVNVEAIPGDGSEAKAGDILVISTRVTDAAKAGASANAVAIIAIEHADPRDLASMFGLKSDMRPEGIAEVTAILPQNALAVSGDPAAIDQLREILALLDRPVKQVEITVRALHGPDGAWRALSLDAFRSGADVGALGLDAFRSVADAEALGAIADDLMQRFQDAGGSITAPSSATGDNNKPIIVTLKQRAANEPDTGTLEVTVTPRINGDDTITMRVVVATISVAGEVAGPGGETIPITRSEVLEVQLTARDGESGVLGGMSAEEGDDNERLIMITPRIVRDVAPEGE